MFSAIALERFDVHSTPDPPAGRSRAHPVQHATNSDEYGDPVRTLAFFENGELAEAPQNGPAELTVVGMLSSGQLFYGRDTVKLTGADKKK